MPCDTTPSAPQLRRRQALVLACGLFASTVSRTAEHAAEAAVWPAWDRFASHFVQADGRVIDLTFERKSTSEGQAYALFFALVANRREDFERLLAWTRDNLAAGQLGERLPGWHWGRRKDGSWGMKDANPASDADLWLAYTLLEAGRLWQAPHHARTGRALLAQISRQEVISAGRAGMLLLPAPVGFQLDSGRTRIDPSYLPGFQFLYLAHVDPGGPWQAVWDNYLRLAPQIFRAGVAPDLVVVDAGGRVGADSERAPAGSYDAIRVYLWAGMSGADSAPLRQRLRPYAELIRRLGVVPEKVDPSTGQAIGPAGAYAPVGYAGAVLPFLQTLDELRLLAQQLERLRADAAAARQGAPQHYFDQALILFGQGWLDGQYRFDADGRLQPAWAR